jgi:ATP/maltotriose-dependent transcriptional regulator MalT
MTSPETVWSGQQDAMSVRDAGWIQMFCDNNQEIADYLGFSPNTVKTYLSRIYVKLNIKKRDELKKYMLK